jgi:predicted dehydrogenase
MKINNHMQHIALIGCGYWGSKILSILSTLYSQSAIHVYEPTLKKIDTITHKNPSINLHSNFNEILKNTEIYACIIATPAPTHYKLAKEILLSGKHVFVEKPMTLSSKEGNLLIQLAHKKNKILMVDHTYIQYLQKHVHTKNFGTPSCYISTRISNGIVRETENVVWDLGIHDLVITRYIFGLNPLFIAVNGSSSLPSKIIDTAQIKLTYPNGIYAYSTVSWNSPIKIRTIQIAGEKQRIVLNTPSSTSSRITIYKALQTSNKEIRHIDIECNKQPLATCLEKFILSINSGHIPYTDGNEGVIVTRILEAADLSCLHKGVNTKIQYD